MRRGLPVGWRQHRPRSEPRFSYRLLGHQIMIREYLLRGLNRMGADHAATRPGSVDAPLTLVPCPLNSSMEPTSGDSSRLRHRLRWTKDDHADCGPLKYLIF